MPLEAELATPGIKRGGPPQRVLRPTRVRRPRSPLGAPSSRAQKDLIQDVRGRAAAGMSPRPDIDLVLVTLKLMMRENIAMLKVGSSWKKYPQAKDFKREARTARVGIGNYVASLKKADAGAPKHKKKIISILDGRLKRLARSMQTNLSKDRGATEAPAPGDDEKAYLLAGD